MSYDIVKNISVKNRTITLAANNLRPITYSTCKVNSPSDEAFIKYVLVNALWGNFHFQKNKNLLKFRLALSKYEDEVDEEVREDIYNKVWRSYDYKTKTHKYTETERVEATQKLGDILYDLYNNIQLTKGNYIIKYGSCWVKKLGITNLRYTWYIEDAKKYDSFEEAKMVENYINKNFSTPAQVEAV